MPEARMTEAIYDFFEEMGIDPDEALDMEDLDRSSWYFQYGEDGIHIVADEAPEFAGEPVIYIATPIGEISDQKAEDKEQYIDLLEKLLEFNLDLYQASLAFVEDMIYLVTQIPGYGVDAEVIKEKFHLLLAQKKKLGRYLWGDSDI